MPHDEDGPLPCWLSTLCDLGPSQATFSLRLILMAAIVFSTVLTLALVAETPTVKNVLARMASVAGPILLAVHRRGDIVDALAQRPAAYGAAAAAAVAAAAIAAKNKNKLIFLV